MKKLLAIILVLSLLLGCAGAFAETTIEYWSSWSETENQALVLQEAAKAYEAAHPGVRINFTFNGRDNRNLVVSAIEAGTQIDVMDANIDNIQKLWANNIMDLSDYMGKTYDTTDGKAYIESVMPSMTSLAASLFGGKTMCIPYIPQAFMIFCNQNIFDEVGITEYPATWDEFLAACEKIKAAGYTPITSDTAYITSWMGYYLSRLMGDAKVAQLVKDKAMWNDPQVLEAAKAIENLAKLGYFDANIASNVYPVAQQDMVIGENIAMYINGTWLPNEVAATTPESFKWGAFAFPAVPNGVEGTEAGCYSTYAIAVNKDASAETADVAVDFIVYLTTSEYDQKFADVASAIPMGNNATWPEDLAAAKNALSSYTIRYPSQTSLTTNSDSKQIIADACLKLMSGQITAEEFVAMASNF